MIAPTQSPVTLESLLGTALSDQHNLSAVERFAKLHDEGLPPAQSRHYASLLPAAPPGPGQQLAFEVDLDRCTSCKACVTACHNRNGLEENEAWRMTGTLLGGGLHKPFQQTVTTACHHCLDPACLNGCPVNAYEKDAVTGIVRHLDDQCIGCKYCMLTCPYDVPQYSVSLGIVRKCDMCAQRLTHGEAPACAQACPNQAIRIRVVDTAEVEARSVTRENSLLPGTPHPEYTKPSTRYVTKRTLPDNLRPADAERAVPEHGHPPLVAMLTLTQASVGVFLIMALFGLSSRWLALGGFFLGNAGLVAALFHLGRPQFAFRAMLGIRHSWLSREIAAFSAYMAAAAAATAWTWFPALESFVPLRLVCSAAAVSGLIGIFTSVMLYHVTRRPSWHMRWSGSKFYLSALVLGTALSATLHPGHQLHVLLILVSAAKLAVDGMQLRDRAGDARDPNIKTARLLLGPLRNFTRTRFALGILGGLLLPLTGSLPALSFVSLLGAEAIERHLFFTSMTAVRMPGSATT